MEMKERVFNEFMDAVCRIKGFKRNTILDEALRSSIKRGDWDEHAHFYIKGRSDMLHEICGELPNQDDS